MWLIKKQQGQSIVEFAIIFPFFMFLLLVFFYLTLFCHDYLVLSGVVRDSARMLATGSSEAIVRQRYVPAAGEKAAGLLIYKWDPSKNATDFVFEIKPEASGQSAVGSYVKVTAKAHDPLWQGISMPNDLNFSLEKEIMVSMIMHKEEQ